MKDLDAPARSFKFSIGEKVYSKLYRRNGMIDYRMLTETIDNSFVEYGVMLWDESGGAAHYEIREEWLENEKINL